MNLVLLDDSDFESETRVRLTGRRHRHVTRVLRAATGDELIVGRLGGRVGRGRVLEIAEGRVTLDVVLDAEPPAPVPITLVLALPRPPVLRRVLAGVTAMGVKHVVLLGARAVEKSFWSSHAIAEAAIEEQLRLGLEQARDTVLPEVALRRRFRPFVEDELPALVANADAFVAHPGVDAPPPARTGANALLAVGPEGGWSDHEVECLRRAGLHPLSLGSRPLRVETAVPALLARLL